MPELQNATVSGLLVSEEDVDLDRLRWHLDGAGAVQNSTYDPKTQRTGKQKIHRIIAARMLSRPLARDESVDHINRNPGDNRRCNLRVVTHKENRRNNGAYKGSSSKYVGVCRLPNGSWLANITVDAQTIYIGRYKDEQQAAWMRDQWAIALHENIHALNFDYVDLNEEEPSRKTISQVFQASEEIIRAGRESEGGEDE